METSQVLEDAGGALEAGVLESFMYFPAPLALLNLHGELELVNNRFAQSLGRSEIDPKGLAALVKDADTGWRTVAGAGGEAGRRIRAVKTPHRVLVIGEDCADGGSSERVDALLTRLGELEQLVATDHLTGAWNRTHLNRVIPSEIARSTANRQPLSLILLDVDHFRRIGDTLGHPAGDAALGELVQLLRSRIRASDLLFRWGGEEFVIMISAAGYRGAETVAETLREAVAHHQFAGAGSLTVSLGVAEHDGNEEAGAWFRRLGKALCTARDGGRNRVAVDRRGNSDRWAAERGASASHLEWLEGYERGNATIDAEHREIFRLANALIDASLAEPCVPASLRMAVDMLIDHVERHFADEEAILSQYCYAQFDEHRRSHAGLLQRARRFQKQADSGDFNMESMIEFLA